MQDLHNLSKDWKKNLKIRIFQIAIHKDEGHYDKDTKRMETELSRSFSSRLAGFANWKTLKHQSFHYSKKMQDLAAECLKWKEDVSGSLTRLEAVEFKIKKKKKI